MKRFAALAVICGVILAAAACAGQDTAQRSGQGEAARAEMAGRGHDAPAANKGEKAARIASEIQADPDNAAMILDRHGMTQEAFEQLLYEVAADPVLSEAYNRAMNR